MKAFLSHCILLLITFLICCLSKATTTSEPLTSLYRGYDASASASVSAASAANGFISSPSIYSYTITNSQNALNASQQKQQRQQVQATYSNNDNSNNNKNNNLINFSTNSQYQNSASVTSANSALNRNFYYTNNNNNNVNSEEQTGSSNAGTLLNKLPPAFNSYASAEQPAAALSSGCTLDRLAVYKVVLHTYWTRDLFPKHYPDWRPTAQWTKTIGK